MVAVVSVENLETGEVHHFYEDIKSDAIEQAQLQTRSGETYTCFTAGVVLDVDLSGVVPNVTIMPLNGNFAGVVVEGTRAEVGITGTSRVQGGVSQMNISSFWGSWQPANLFFMSGRSATLNLMTSNRSLNLAPTSNTFSTGSNQAPATWGWSAVSSAAFARSEATVNVSGMSATHTITAGFFLR